MRLRMPAEREWLEENSIGDLERCGGISCVTKENCRAGSWQSHGNDSGPPSMRVRGIISIGMRHPARSQPKAYLLQKRRER